jgi:heterodisulfide reductase subunit C
MVPWRDPAYNPRRVLHKASLGMRQAVFDDVTIWYCTACDLCYTTCPQQVHISDVIGALRQLALEAGYTSPLETVTVDPVLCAGCGNCVEVCPYEALSLEPHGDVCISTVDHNRCMGCGGCVAVCPNNAIGGGSFADQRVREQLNGVFWQWA